MLLQLTGEEALAVALGAEVALGSIWLICFGRNLRTEHDFKFVNLTLHDFKVP
jgi:hypothetical protein